MTAMAWEAAAAEWEAVDAGPRWATPGELARAVDPSTVQTPALDLIDEALVWAHTTRGARLIISIAPQEGKSTRVSRAGCLWALIRNPETRIGIASYAQPLAEGFGRDIRNWISTFNGDEDTVDLGLRIAPDYGSAKRWQLDGHRGGVVCVGIGSGFTGRPAEALVIDDPFADKEQADSAYQRNRVWGWWQSVAIPRLAPGAPVILVNTRWHEDDLAGRLTAAEDGHRWRVLNIPALADHKPEAGESDLLGREPGQWLESARGRTAAEWEQIRISVGSRVFTALYQGRPSPDQGNVWQRQWWRRYREPLWSQHPETAGAWLVPGADEVLISVDCSFKDTKSSDFVVMQAWARFGAMAYLVDQVRKRLSFTDTVTALTAFVGKWPQATRKLVEDKANGTAVIDSLRSKIPGLVPVNPTNSKYGRATAVAPVIESGNVLLPDPSVALFDAEELITEAAQFPNSSNDDQVDAASQALAEMFLDGTGAQAWIAWIKRKAEAVEREAAGEAPDPRAAVAMSAPQSPAEPLAKCRKPDCMRKVRDTVAYCCRSCSQADVGGYELSPHDPSAHWVLSHSADCEERSAERGEVTPAEERILDATATLRAARTAMFRQQR